MRYAETYFLMFFTLSVAGWLIEVSCKYIEFRRFINRGFLIGPYCPVYGMGAVLVCLILGNDPPSPIFTFIRSMVICGVLEYATGYIMEKLFHARWWDYSTRRFNINGRVCLETLVSFGALSLLCVYFIKPTLFSLFGRLSDTTMHVLCIIFMTVLAADIVVSVKVLLHISSSADSTQADSTEALTLAIRKELKAKGILIRRPLQAFPYAKLYNKKLRTQIRETHLKLSAEAKKIRDSIRAGKFD